MRFTELLTQKSENLASIDTPTIAFLGDSVTQGCFELYLTESGDIASTVDQDSVYHADFAKLLHLLWPKCPVNIINAGISGDSAPGGLRRLERDVLSHNPNLTVVSFGLNDSCRGLRNAMEMYCDALREIFRKLTESGSEVIYMTQNMMNTTISRNLSEEKYRAIAEKSMEKETDGTLARYYEAGKAIAAEYGVKVCDVYAKWKRLQANGVKTTDLLANSINHPTRPMHWLFAMSLLETLTE